MKEEWTEVPEFPWYSVSNTGEVSSDRTGKILSQNINQQGIPHVGLAIDGKIYRKSVSVLVAEAFLPPSRFSHFTTPTHLDGDKLNNFVTNLVWRPRWFAIQYQRQFYDVHSSMQNMPVEIINTGEVFEHTIDLCMKYGVLVMDVVRAVHHAGSKVPFGGFEVRVPKK